MALLFVEQVLGNCMAHPHRIAFALENGTTFSYGELSRHVAGVAELFQAHGVHAGSPVILAAARGPGFLFAYLALHALNAVVVPLDPQTPESRLRFIQKQLGDVPTFWPEALHGAINATALDMLTSDTLPDHRTIPPESLADIIFTSGTTGNPKGVMLTHANLACAVAHINAYIGNGADDVEVCPMPLSHSFGLARMRCTLAQGGKLVIADGVSKPKRLFEIMKEHKATGLGMVGPAWTFVRRISGDRISQFKDQLRFIEFGSAILPTEEKRHLMELLPHTRLVMHYGLTEASRATFLDFHDEPNHLESVGRAGPSAEIAVFDSMGHRLSAGETGEICVRGGMVSKGYINASPSFFKEEFFRTGDLGWMDDNGYVTLVGRLKELINVGGEKVSPLEVESVLNTLPGVAESACTSMPDPVLGEVVAAFLVVKADASCLELNDILPILKIRLEGYKIPKRIQYINALPCTVSGKVNRRALQEYL